MADALDKSLDDLIKEQRQAPKKQQQQQQKKKKKTPKPKSAGPARMDRDDDNGGGGGGGRRRGGAKRGGGAAAGPLSITIKAKGGGAVQKRRSEGGAGPRVVVDRERLDPSLRAAALEGGARWHHDMYREGPRRGGGAGGGGGRERRDPRGPHPAGTKLFIGNLHFNVSSGDLAELFSTVGPLLAHGVHYDDRDGRSRGTGEAVYARAADAERALAQYNGVELDGRAMRIELIPPAAQLSSGVRVGPAGGGGGGRPHVVGAPRAFAQAAGAAARPRGRGGVKSRIVGDAMQE